LKHAVFLQSLLPRPFHFQQGLAVILLSKVLQGDTDIQDITLNDWNWYKENNIQLYTALFVCARNRKDKRDRACRQDEFIVRLDSVCIGDYNRILLSKVLQGDTDIQDITLNDWNWYKENNIQDDCFTGIQLDVVFFVPVPIV
jgi:NAD(P)H-nitrite reductase large subunit